MDIFSVLFPRFCLVQKSIRDFELSSLLMCMMISAIANFVNDGYRTLGDGSLYFADLYDVFIVSGAS